MAQTLTSLHIHLIFSTKYRANLINPEIEKELFSYIGGILNKNQSKLLAANGTGNHIHILISINKNIALSKLVGDLKRSSSKWIKTKGKDFKIFQWQDGYGAFSVGYTQIDAVKKYIANQKTHHRQIGFEDEFRYFLRKYKVAYDEQFIWI